jgi:hypothetical protein
MNNESKEFIDKLGKAEKWELLNTILHSINVPLSKTGTLFAYAQCCFSYRQKLPIYRNFVPNVQIELRKRGIK